MKILPAIAIRNPVFSWMLMLGLMFFGYLQFKEMGVSQLPDVDFPVVSVSLTYEGAAPEVVERDILEPLEKALLSIDGIENLDSTARYGQGSISVEFKIEKNIDIAVQEIQSQLAKSQRSLPKGVEAPIVSKSNPEDQPILWIGVQSKTLAKEKFMEWTDDVLAPQFARVAGVSEVILGGFVDPTLRIDVHPKQLEANQLTVGDLVQAIQTEHQEVPAGFYENATREWNLRAPGEFSSVDEFRKLPIQRRGGSPIYRRIQLGDVANVQLGLGEVRRLSRAQGQPAIGLGIKKQSGTNAVEVAKAVKAQMEKIRPTVPPGVAMDVNFDSTTFIEESIEELIFTLLLSGLLTGAVCWVCLGRWSTTANVLMAIPTSLLGSFIVLKAMGFTLNTFTLMALSLAIGIVVDDAIMVLENIIRHFRLKSGQAPEVAALEGAQEISFAAFAATASVIAIFLPVAFMSGLIGRYFFQFGVALSVAVAFSLLEALTLTPMRMSRTKNMDTVPGWYAPIERLWQWCERQYLRILVPAIRHRRLTLVAALAFFAGSLALFPLLPKEFIPPQDQSRLMLRIKTPDGTSLALTAQKMAEIEKILLADPRVNRIFGSVGGFGGGVSSSAMLFVTLIPRDQRKVSQLEISEEFRNQFKELKGVRVTVMDPSLSMFGGGGSRSTPIDLQLKGDDWATLMATAEKTVKMLREDDRLRDVDTGLRGLAEEIQIVPDRKAAQERGVSISDLVQTVQSLYGGVLAGKFSDGSHRLDVRVQMQTGQVPEEAIKSILIRNNRGELLPLTQVAHIERRQSLLSITRNQRERSISVQANLKPGSSQAEVSKAVLEKVRASLPPGTHVEPGASSQMFQNTGKSLVVALLLGLVVAFMILASQFNSWRDPWIVLLALPFSITGAFGFLLAFHQSLNLFSMIGILLLMGIVKKNAILLVEFANHVRDHGKSRYDSMVEAGRVRLRPILMTSIATIAGAVPAALALGPGAESRVPMAVAILGGVLVSTLLTLVVVPAGYVLGEKRR